MDVATGLRNLPVGLDAVSDLPRETATALVSAEPSTRGRIVDADAAMAELLGSTVALLRGRDLADHLRKDDPDDAGELSDVLDGRRVRAIGLRQLVTVEGAVVECHLSAALAPPRDGRPPAVVVSVSPVGGALRRARDDARSDGDALDAAPFGVAIFDRWGRCVRANLAWTQLGGVVAETDADHTLLAFVEDADAARAAIDAAMGGVRQELRLRSANPDGSPLSVRMVLVPREQGEHLQGGFMAFARDPGEEVEAAWGDEDLVGPGVAARTLGISHSTLRRWVEDGRIEAVRTSGGHRRITRCELRRVARSMGRPARVRRAAAPDRALPVLAAVLRERGAALSAGAAVATYEQDLPGWFADAAADRALTSWRERVACAVADGRSPEAVAATRALFAAARDVAGLEECLVFADRLSLLLLEHVRREPGGALEARDAAQLLAAMRRELVVLEDERG